MTDRLHTVDFQKARRDEVVEELERALEEAKAGKIDAVTIAVRRTDNPSWAWKEAGNCRRFELMGVLQAQILTINAWGQRDDEEGEL